MNYPKYYIEKEQNTLVIWRADIGGIEIGMNDSPFESSNCTEEQLKLVNDIKEITYHEAKSLFPNLIK